jgi:hypothetical protein
MLEKKRVVFSKRRSAHPVLWICSGLSTAEAPKSAFFRKNRSLARIWPLGSPPGKQHELLAGTLKKRFALRTSWRCMHRQARRVDSCVHAVQRWQPGERIFAITPCIPFPAKPLTSR